nr:hypothetical protein KPHV_45910 [Kitasatospora purpeofusca]
MLRQTPPTPPGRRRPPTLRLGKLRRRGADQPLQRFCRSENHGLGKAAPPTQPEAPDRSTAPAPLWRPGSGTVEVDPTHHRLAGRSPFSRHGTRVRAPSVAWTGSVEDASKDRS